MNGSPAEISGSGQRVAPRTKTEIPCRWTSTLSGGTSGNAGQIQ